MEVRGKNLTGVHVNNWNVLGLSDRKNKAGKPLWDCVCDCQMNLPEEEKQHRYLTTYDITSGKAKCKNCYVKPNVINVKEMVGKTYHRLFVVKDLGRIVKEGTTQPKRYLECTCQCDGKTIIAPAYDIYHGNIKSCGCLQREFAESQKGTQRKFNEYKVFGEITFVKFSNCNEWFICDTDDWENLKNHCWHKSVYGYATSLIDGKTSFMHKIIMHTPDYLETDHIHQVKYGVCDNRKKNLEIKPRKYNALNSGLSKNNTSGYKGVTLSKNKKKWIARIMIDGKNIYLGTFDTFEEAVEARRKAEEKYSGGYKMNTL